MDGAPVSKRPKLKNARAAQSADGIPVFSKSLVSVSKENLKDFCGSLLKDAELDYLLKTTVTRRRNQPVLEKPPPIVLKPVPLQFGSAQEYANVFHPLMLEEAKACLMNGALANARRIGFDLLLRSSEECDDFSFGAGDGTVQIKLRARIRVGSRNTDWKVEEKKQLVRHPSDGRVDPCGMSNIQRGDILIFLSSVMARRSVGAFETDSSFLVLGVASRTARVAPSHGGEPGGVDIDVITLKASAERLKNVVVHAYVVDDANVVTTWREWDGLNSLLAEKEIIGSRWSSSLIPALLRGGVSAAANRSAATDLPESRYVVEYDPNMPLTLPGATPLYQRDLIERYNPSQIDAIVTACTSKKDFVLVQGPPGTGKTHTLLALINSLHLSVCQQCYDDNLPNPNISTNEVKENVRFDWLRDKSNPHLLIVAPSNAAIDNVLMLVIKKGLLDGLGNRYLPKCSRLGSINWNNARNAEDPMLKMSLDWQVDELIRQRSHYADPKAVSETDGLVVRLKGLEAEIRRLNTILVEVANRCALTRDEADLMEFSERAGEWVGHRNRARDLALELERRRLLYSQSNSSEGAVRADLRALVLSQADLVFATLSQCGSPTMLEIAPSRVKFQVCVIDEAAQAVEPSTLIPFSLGVAKCVMVGDPNQLPATVISERATKADYQQSLFERLQRCGHPVHLLDTQYRCRPELSSFCSGTFYAGKLKDGPNVLTPSYALPMYRHQCFGPLVFFDVGFGSQSRSATSLSLSNEAEAAVCEALYMALRTSIATEALSPLSRLPVHVAVISPYREQLALLQSKFKEHIAEDRLLELNTVDGFQGREVDVVIFSCVRAYTSSVKSSLAADDLQDSGIGFLNDARRLNVAATRARFSLLMVGNKDVLTKGSRMWRGLLDHIRTRGRLIQVDHPNFPFVDKSILESE